ncbi:MAG: hypothetical protein LBV23_05270 [Deltaproteobacteria bacterium]|jgi:hypothetical protein|nr:hypothetical protein [Deltaproteobacteria bacterium]
MKIYLGPGAPDPRNGEIFEGKDKLELLKWMINPPCFTMNTEKDPDRFMVQCINDINELLGRNLKLKGSTLEERLDSFFDILVANNMAIWVPDNPINNGGNK